MCLYKMFQTKGIAFIMLNDAWRSSKISLVRLYQYSSFMSNSLWPHGLYSPWSSLGQNIGVGSRSLLQGDLPNSGIKPRSLALQADSLPAEPPGKSRLYQHSRTSDYLQMVYLLLESATKESAASNSYIYMSPVISVSHCSVLEEMLSLVSMQWNMRYR